MPCSRRVIPSISEELPTTRGVMSTISSLLSVRVVFCRKSPPTTGTRAIAGTPSSMRCSRFEIDVAGASTAGERYIQTRAGLKMREGAAPDAGSRLVMVGELGVAVEHTAGLSAVIFDSDLNWLTR